MEEQKKQEPLAGTPAAQDTEEDLKKGKNADEGCRCREVSEKTLPDLFRLMIRDLSFWRKPDRKK